MKKVDPSLVEKAVTGEGKNKRLRASETHDNSTRKERTEHKEHAGKMAMLNSVLV